jgi:hydrogenase nickel incorporation protein HypB
MRQGCIGLAGMVEPIHKLKSYPAPLTEIFAKSELMVLNKVDLLTYVPFSVQQARENALRVHPGIEIIEVSCTTGQGLDNWMAWLQSRHEQALAAVSA